MCTIMYNNIVTYTNVHTHMLYVSLYIYNYLVPFCDSGLNILHFEPSFCYKRAIYQERKSDFKGNTIST